MGDNLITKVSPWIAASEAITNPLLAHFTNVKNRKFTREMYKTQRQDALADWEMQNEYNSPRAQMQRFQEAGLNPNLIYGQGNEGNAQPVRSSNAPAGTADAPEFKGSQSLMSIYDMRMKKAQTDNLALQRSLMERQIENTAAQTIKTLSEVDLTNMNVKRGAVQLALESQLSQFHVQHADLVNRKLETETGIMIETNERHRIMQQKTLEKMAEEILSIQIGRAKSQAEINNLKQNLELMKKDGTLKDYDIKMREAGINPGDPGFWRVIKEIWSGMKEGMTRDNPSSKPWEGQQSGQNQRGTWRDLPKN